MPKRMYYVDNAQGLYIDLYPGKQLLKGEELEGFLRFRHDETGDLGRGCDEGLYENVDWGSILDKGDMVRIERTDGVARGN